MLPVPPRARAAHLPKTPLLLASNRATAPASPLTRTVANTAQRSPVSHHGTVGFPFQGSSGQGSHIGVNSLFSTRPASCLDHFVFLPIAAVSFSGFTSTGNVT